MNLDNDYDNDGNNIVPCPICLNVYCLSKEGGKCPEEDEFVKAMSHTEQPEECCEKCHRYAEEYHDCRTCPCHASPEQPEWAEEREWILSASEARRFTLTKSDADYIAHHIYSLLSTQRSQILAEATADGYKLAVKHLNQAYQANGTTTVPEAIEWLEDNARLTQDTLKDK